MYIFPIAGLLLTVLVLVRALQTRSWKYRLEKDGTQMVDGPLISVIIPARNEQDSLPKTIDSVLNQGYENLEILVIDDRSTDNTASIVQGYEDDRVELIKGNTAPDSSWTGKCWAVHQGVQQAQGNWYLFLDADMELKPWLLSRVMGENIKKDELFSLLPGASCKGFWNRVVLPLHGFMIMLGFPLHAVNNPDSSVVLAAGGFILIHQQCYQSCGGHEAIRDSIAEDLALARQVKSTGGSIRLLSSSGLNSEHYRDLSDLFDGITKHLLASPWPPGLLIPSVLSLLFTCFVLPPFLPEFWTTTVLWAPWAGSILFIHLLYAGIQRELHHPPLYAMLAIPGMILYGFIGGYALFQLWRFGGPNWKGRRIQT